MIVFFVMSCVALSRSNSSAVADACGQDMWNVMLSSLVIRVVLVFFLFVPLVYVDENKDILPREDRHVDTVFFRFIFLAAVCTMCVLEGIYIANGFGDEQCKNALISESKIDSPLLLEIGAVGLVIDIIMAVLQGWNFIEMLPGICGERDLRYYWCGCRLPCCC